MKWKRITEFEPKSKSNETWICRDQNFEKKFDVKVNFSKQVDILKLKNKTINDFESHVEKVKKSREKLY